MNDTINTDRKSGYQQSVLSLMQFKSQFYSNRAALNLFEDQQWKSTTYRELAEKVKSLSDYLIESGFRPSDKIAILSESRPEWAVALFSAVRCGAITVPLDTKLTATELASIVEDAEPCLVFASSQYADVALRLKSRSSSIREVILLDDRDDRNDLRSISQLLASSSQEGVDRGIDETALIVYTSGTTAAPKGVMITFRNLGFQIMSFEEVIKLNDRDMLLSMLPLNHLLELTCGLLGALYAGGRICYYHSLFPHELVDVMRQKKITCMITVPLFLKMLKSSIEKEVNRSSRMSRLLFQFALSIAQWLPSRLRRLLFHRVHKQLGGKLRAVITGGAPMDVEVAEFFDRLGLSVYQGYGLTETAPVISVNTARHNRIGSVGKPLPGAQVKITGDGEILTAGPHVMKGYYKREDLTREVIDDQGWFHTGDIGHLDQDGYLYITGRVKNLIVLGSGKKVNPEEVEQALSNSALFKEVCVLGKPCLNGIRKGSEEICAVVVPSSELAQRSMNAREIEEEITSEVQRLSLGLAPYKRPVKVLVSRDDLPKTSTRKVKRALVHEWVMQEESMHEVVAAS